MSERRLNGIYKLFHESNLKATFKIIPTINLWRYLVSQKAKEHTKGGEGDKTQT